MTPDSGHGVAGAGIPNKRQASDIGYSVCMRDGPLGDADLGKQIGTVIKTAREETGWSQRELARRLRTSHSAVQRLEAGHSPYVDTRLATAAFGLLGIRSSFDARTLGLAGRREQRDLVHAWCLSYTSRRLRADGWEVRTEVEIGDGRYRGWIDLLAYRDVDRCLLCGEIKTEIDDVGRIQRTVGWYGREAVNAARRLEWRPRTTTTALLVLCSADNDGAIRQNHDILRGSFPGMTRGLLDWITVAGTPVPAPSMAMLDPSSRRRDWLRPTVSEGRRTSAPYANYAEAAAAIRRRAVSGW
jgi:transcriptional regulator with XRE-family HTH domain